MIFWLALLVLVLIFSRQIKVDRDPSTWEGFLYQKALQGKQRIFRSAYYLVYKVNAGCYIKFPRFHFYPIKTHVHLPFCLNDVNIQDFDGLVDACRAYGYFETFGINAKHLPFTVLKSIGQHIPCSHYVVTIIVENSIQFNVRSRGFVKRLVKKRGVSTVKLQTTVAQLLLLQLSFDGNLGDPVLQIANEFIKRLKFDADFQLKLTAAKLGLKPQWLVQFPSFYKFATKNALHRYLYIYGHSLQVKQDSIWILYKNEYRKWQEVEQLIRRDPTKPLVIKGQYSEQGLVDKCLHEWTRFKPFIHLAKSKNSPLVHDWGNRYILEICAWIVEKPRLGGDHLWIRFKTPQGEIYSVGQYRPRKLQFHEQFIFPMRIKTSQFFSPDLCEFWKGPYTCFSVEITKGEFDKMLAKIEMDQQEQVQIYQIIDNNCVKWTLSILQLANIHLPTTISVLDLLLSSSIMKLVNLLPKPFHFIILILCTFVLNLLALLLGAGMVDPQLKGTKPWITSIHDMFDTSKIIAMHPFVVGEYVRTDIERWRLEQIQATTDPIKKESLKYQLPQRYRLE